MDDEQFSRYVDEAIASLPQEFREKLDNVAVVVDEYPTALQLQKLKMRDGSMLLLGLYEGIPQTKRNAGYGVGGTLPDKITIFKQPILQVTRSEQETVAQIRSTVLHEIAHHFGMDEKAVRQAELKRRKTSKSSS